MDMSPSDRFRTAIDLPPAALYNQTIMHLITQFIPLNCKIHVYTTHFLGDDWDNIHTLSYYHHQIGIMNYYPLLGLGHETMICTVCLSIFLRTYSATTVP